MSKTNIPEKDYLRELSFASSGYVNNTQNHNLYQSVKNFFETRQIGNQSNLSQINFFNYSPLNCPSNNPQFYNQSFSNFNNSFYNSGQFQHLNNFTSCQNLKDTKLLENNNYFAQINNYLKFLAAKAYSSPYDYLRQQQAILNHSFINDLSKIFVSLNSLHKFSGNFRNRECSTLIKDESTKFNEKIASQIVNCSDSRRDSRINTRTNSGNQEELEKNENMDKNRIMPERVTKIVKLNTREILKRQRQVDNEVSKGQKMKIDSFKRNSSRIKKAFEKAESFHFNLSSPNDEPNNLSNKKIFKIINCESKNLQKKIPKTHNHSKNKDKIEQHLLGTNNISAEDYGEEELRYSCNHPNCEAKFKTRRQKMTHHMKCDNECKKEKHGIIRLIAVYIETIGNIVKKCQSQSNKDLFLVMKKELKEFVKEKDPLRLEYFNCTISVD